MTDIFNESTVEDAALSWFEELGYADRARAAHRARRTGGGAGLVWRCGAGRAACARPSTGSTPTFPTKPARRRSARCCASARRRSSGPTGPFTGCCAMAWRSSTAARTARIAGDRVRLVDFDDPDEQRLAGGQPVHGDRGPAQPAAGHRGLRQRAAAGRDRAEERGRRGRDDLDAPTTSCRPTSRRFRRCSHYNEAAGRLRRPAGPHRLADGQPGMVQGLADD